MIERKTGLRSPARDLVVRSLSRRATRGRLSLGSLSFPCALGRSGQRHGKREGDGATPLGSFAIGLMLYRADRMPRPRTALPARPIRGADGWCDAPGDRNYNRAVRHPYPASAERLWRGDALYDLVLVVDYNRLPRVPYRGSAIFIHVARDGLGPTEGCIALERSHLIRLAAALGRQTRVTVV